MIRAAQVLTWPDHYHSFLLMVYTTWLIKFSLSKRTTGADPVSLLFLEDPFLLGLEAHWVSTIVDTLILQSANRIAPELVIFGEYRYHRD